MRGLWRLGLTLHPWRSAPASYPAVQRWALSSGLAGDETAQHCGDEAPTSLQAWNALPCVKRLTHAGSTDARFLPQQVAEVRPDPFSIVQEEIESITERIRRSVLTGIPALESAASYFFKRKGEGKRFRPTMLMLMASSLGADAPSPHVLTVDDRPHGEHPRERRRRQQRLAEIAEMIHVASLLHDDVIDSATTRRGLAALNSVVGNKIAILAGDFLLARASVSLASLRQPEVIKLMSQVLEDLVTGEILQLTASSAQRLSMDHYLQKTFYKTGSLIANSCKAIAVLSGQSREVVDIAWDFGKNLGLAFQLVDDVLDFTGSSLVMGKPALSDLRNGLATAPVLFAAQDYPELESLIERKFQAPGDVDHALKLIGLSVGVEKTRMLATSHVRAAVDQILKLPPAPTEYALLCREALIDICSRVLNRKA
eukprot:jgi/Botrbrau1/11148/Bobra.182_2s0003.2